jgi:hypothetical protein
MESSEPRAFRMKGNRQQHNGGRTSACGTSVALRPVLPEIPSPLKTIWATPHFRNARPRNTLERRNPPFPPPWNPARPIDSAILRPQTYESITVTHGARTRPWPHPALSKTRSVATAPPLIVPAVRKKYLGSQGSPHFSLTHLPLFPSLHLRVNPSPPPSNRKPSTLLTNRCRSLLRRPCVASVPLWCPSCPSSPPSLPRPIGQNPKLCTVTYYATTTCGTIADRNSSVTVNLWKISTYVTPWDF